MGEAELAGAERADRLCAGRHRSWQPRAR
jgi:hypothetical protein